MLSDHVLASLWLLDHLDMLIGSRASTLSLIFTCVVNELINGEIEKPS